MSVESPRAMSDPVSPYDRPIRPLPKRRLRERLSPEVADQIQYPPAAPISTPLFYPSYTIREDVTTPRAADSPILVSRERGEDVRRRDYISRRIGEDVESEEDEAVFTDPVSTRQTSETPARTYRYVPKPEARQPNPQVPPSAASSVDGYDSFENTNNKKKRKIPTPGENGVHLSADVIGSAGEESPEDTHPLTTNYHTSGSSSSGGLSGPGRGRYGRNRNGRSPLRTLSDSSGSWGNGRLSKPRAQWSLPAESPGIISRSIANANAEKNPISPASGQENFSSLQQQASKKATPSSQFTFTCDSQVPPTVPWPDPATPLQHAPASATRTQSTQTNQNMPNNVNSIPPVASKPQADSRSLGPQSRPRKPRRNPEKEYLAAARERREAQETRNLHHPPAPSDIWICEFCEYERIFGAPPLALIRQYEIKDRRVKKQEAERRRLLEKAKMKGRKGKKYKGALRTLDSTRQTQQNQVQPPPPLHHSQSQTQSEEYYEDDYNEEYPADEPPPPSPAGPAVAQIHANHHTDPGRNAASSTHAGGGRNQTGITT